VHPGGRRCGRPVGVRRTGRSSDKPSPERHGQVRPPGLHVGSLRLALVVRTVPARRGTDHRQCRTRPGVPARQRLPRSSRLRGSGGGTPRATEPGSRTVNESESCSPPPMWTITSSVPGHAVPRVVWMASVGVTRCPRFRPPTEYSPDPPAPPPPPSPPRRHVVRRRRTERTGRVERRSSEGRTRRPDPPAEP
jgi:hypothetical protein